jgi:hypothetical protein
MQSCEARPSTANLTRDPMAILILTDSTVYVCGKSLGRGACGCALCDG